MDALVVDDDTPSLATIGRHLAIRLSRVNPFEATAIAATAALDPVARARHVLAEALAYSFPLVGDDFVLDHLIRDPDDDVRTAAVRAHAARFSVPALHPK